MKRSLRWLLAGFSAGAACTAALVGLTLAETRRVQRLVPADGEFVDVEGARLHYVDRGQGQPIVMIHGLGGQMRNFNFIIDLLAPDFRVILIDRPGSGYSTAAPGSAANLRAQAALVAKFLDVMQLERPLIVGHSLGGGVALALALDCPEKVAGLALIAPLTQLVDALPPSFRGLMIQSESVRRLLAWTMVAPASRWGSRTPIADIFSPDAVPDEFDVRGGNLLARRPANFQAASADLRAAAEDLSDMMARYPQLRMPVQVLFGKGDTVLDPELHGRLLAAAVPDLRLDIIEGGHMLPVTAPEATAEWIAAAARRLAG